MCRRMRAIDERRDSRQERADLARTRCIGSPSRTEVRAALGSSPPLGYPSRARTGRDDRGSSADVWCPSRTRTAGSLRSRRTPFVSGEQGAACGGGGAPLSLPLSPAVADRDALRLAQELLGRAAEAEDLEDLIAAARALLAAPARDEGRGWGEDQFTG